MASTPSPGNRITVKGDSNNVTGAEHSIAGNNNSVGPQPRDGAPQTDPAPTEVLGPPAPATISDRDVFVIHGQDEAARQAVFALLHSLNLRPLEWEALVGRTGKALPYLGEVITRAA